MRCGPSRLLDLLLDALDGFGVILASPQPSQQDGPVRHRGYSRGRLEVIVLFHLPGSAVVVAEGLGNLQSVQSHRCLRVLTAAWW